MNRRVYLLGVGLALVALALAFTDWALSLRPGITEANVRRIRVGMTLGEVGALLGGRATKEITANPLSRVALEIKEDPKAPPRKRPVCGTSLRTASQEGGGRFAPWDYNLVRNLFSSRALRTWEGMQGVADVLFDEGGRVMDAKFWPRESNGPLACLRAWLGW
jgi:hypothetical protein